MADQLKTGAAQTTSMSEFLAKARKLAEVKPLAAPAKGRGQNYGAASRQKWQRTPDTPAEPAQDEAPQADEATDEEPGAA